MPPRRFANVNATASSSTPRVSSSSRTPHALHSRSTHPRPTRPIPHCRRASAARASPSPPRRCCPHAVVPVPPDQRRLNPPPPPSVSARPLRRARLSARRITVGLIWSLQQYHGC